MTETYSLAATGARADQLQGVSNVSVGDTAGLAGSQMSCAANGTPVLCKNPDGSKQYYVIDASRTLPGQRVVLKAM